MPRQAIVTGEVVDQATGQTIASRVYIQDQDGRWFFPESAAPAGSAIGYERRNWLNTNAVEFHTTLSAHPFRVELPPGHYTVTAEQVLERQPRGYRPREIYEQNTALREVLDFIRNGAVSGGHAGLFRPLVDNLLWNDPFLVLADCNYSGLIRGI